MNKPIDGAVLLRSSLARVPPPMNLHVVGHLDRQARRWIAASPLMFAAFGDASGLGVTLGGGEAGFASADTYELRLPVAQLDDAALAVPSQGFGALFLLPCIGETMRVIGTVRAVRESQIHIAVEECYGHSDKALIRSEFWTSLLETLAPRGIHGLAAAHRFMALATVDAEGRVELSPKDDPAGILARIEAGETGRSGCAVDDIQHPAHTAAMVLVLGSGEVASVSGRARITADRTAGSPFVFRDETSALAAVIEDADIAVGDSQTLLRLELLRNRAPRQRMRRPLRDHAGMNPNEGLGTELAKAALAVPGIPDLLRRGLETGGIDNCRAPL